MKDLQLSHEFCRGKMTSQRLQQARDATSKMEILIPQQREAKMHFLKAIKLKPKQPTWVPAFTPSK